MTKRIQDGQNFSKAEKARRGDKLSSVTVTSNLQRVEKATVTAMQRAARMIGGTIEGHAKEYCPVDTGLLRNSITFAIGGENANVQSYKSNNRDKTGQEIETKTGSYGEAAPADTAGEVTVYVGSNVYYAPYQELGAPNINLEARPFIRPAFENHRNEIEQIIRQQLESI